MRADLNDADSPFDPVAARWRTETPTTADELLAWQLARVWEIAERLAVDNPFYKPLLAPLPAGRSAADFRSLPVTTKDAVVADCRAHPPYGARSQCRPDEIRTVVETSGTSGKGREIYVMNDADEEAAIAMEACGFWWAGVRPGSRVLLTLPVGMTAAGHWYYEGLRRLGANVLSVGAYPTQKKVEMLARYGADLVVGTPTYVQRLAVACEEEGVDPAALGVQALIVAGEAYGAGWVQMMQQVWGATLYEQWGCTERAVAWTCPGRRLARREAGGPALPGRDRLLRSARPADERTRRGRRNRRAFHHASDRHRLAVAALRDAGPRAVDRPRLLLVREAARGHPGGQRAALRRHA